MDPLTYNAWVFVSINDLMVMDVGMLAMWSDIDRVIIIFVLSEKCANNGDRSGKYT